MKAKRKGFPIRFDSLKFGKFVRKAHREMLRNPIVKFSSQIDKKTGSIIGTYTFKDGSKSKQVIGSFSECGHFGSVIACDPRMPLRLSK